MVGARCGNSHGREVLPCGQLVVKPLPCFVPHSASGGRKVASTPTKSVGAPVVVVLTGAQALREHPSQWGNACPFDAGGGRRPVYATHEEVNA